MNISLTLANLVSPITTAIEGIAPITAEALHGCALRGDVQGVLDMLTACDEAIEINIFDTKKSSFAHGAVKSIRCLVETLIVE